MSVRIHDYMFETVLGSGTFGKVHLVRRRRDRKPYVIKELDISDKAKSSYEMVLREVQCLQRMRHPNIIAYHNAWIEDKFCYILMECANRGTLKDLLERRGRPLEKDMTLGVHHIHSKKILHRDLKPENIMLTGRHGDIVKIGDFGVSKSIQECLGHSQAGSYYYMAPEMLRSETCGFKGDVWSLGAILYQMSTNELPFEASTYEELIDCVFDRKIRPISIIAGPEIINLICKMLRLDPVRRPSTEQLLLYNHLVPHVIRVHLNVGRVHVGRRVSSTSFEVDTLRSYAKKNETEVVV